MKEKETILMVQSGAVQKRVVYGMKLQEQVTVQMQTQTEY